MTPREIVLANLERANPPRPAMVFTTPGWLNDMTGGGLAPSTRWTQRRWTEGQFEYYDDAWGNVWRRIRGMSSGGEVHEPAITDWRQLDDLQLPDFDDPARVAHLAAQYRQEPDKFRLAGVPGWVFATSRYLRKMEVYFSDLIEYPEEVDRLHDLVTGLFERTIHNLGQAGADGIFFCEDLGVQDSLLIGPPMWRRVFKRHYQRLTAAAHEHGMKVLQHSCGFVWPLVDDLVEAGVDAFQFDQPAAYDMPALAAKLREHGVALWSPVDIQQVMPTGDRARIEAEAETMVRLFGGGFLAKNYPDLHGIGVEPEWDRWAYNAFCRAAGVPEAQDQQPK